MKHIPKAITCLLGVVTVFLLPLFAGANLPAPTAPIQLFGTVEFMAASLSATPQWIRLLKKIEEETPQYRECALGRAGCPSRSARAWQIMVQDQVGRPAHDQLASVNSFINDWQYVSDMQNWGRGDYWATPLEFLARGGDCEDYVIIKYVTLRQLGFGAEQLRLVVVNDVERGLAHAVLAVYLDDDVYVLDNLSRLVLPQEQVTGYVPYYSVNETTRWAHVAPVSDLPEEE